MKISLSKFIYYLLSTLLVLFYLSDIANKILHYEYESNLSISIITRTIGEILFLFVGLLILNKNNNYKLYLSIIVSSLLTLTGLTIYLINTDSLSFNNIISNVIVLNKYYFSFIIFPLVHYLSVNNRTLFNKLVNIFLFVFILNSVLSIIGMFSGIEVLRTYPYSLRYGYSGFIPRQNEATLFYLLGLWVIYVKYFHTKEIGKVILLFAVAGVLTLGTKGSLIILLLLGVYHFKGVLFKFKTIFLLSSFTIVSVYVLWEFTNTFEVYEYIFRTHGIWTGLLSTRDQIFINELKVISSNWILPNLFISGQNQALNPVEMDFFDLFFFMGLIGGTFYLVLLKKYFFTKTKGLSKYFFISYIILAFFGGHFFVSAVNSLYFVITAIFIQNQMKTS